MMTPTAPTASGVPIDAHLVDLKTFRDVLGVLIATIFVMTMMIIVSYQRLSQESSTTLANVGLNLTCAAFVRATVITILTVKEILSVYIEVMVMML